MTDKVNCLTLQIAARMKLYASRDQHPASANEYVSSNRVSGASPLQITVEIRLQGTGRAGFPLTCFQAFAQPR